MYAYIKGEVMEIAEDNLVIECNQVGYNIKIPYSVAQRLPGIGAQVKVYTYTCVREDAFVLYGFLSKEDLWFFKKLITVNGIGPKGALGILSAMSADDLRFAIIAGDAKAIAKAPGIGAKSAERIILDLKDKIHLDTNIEQPTMVAMGNSFQSTGAKNEAIEAMTALGYSASEAVKAVNQVGVTEDMDAGAILKLALKAVVR